MQLLYNLNIKKLQYPVKSNIYEKGQKPKGKGERCFIRVGSSLK